MVAWDALKGAKNIEVLVASAAFGVGKPTGASLARALRVRRPRVKVVLIGDQEGDDEHYLGGAFLAAPLVPAAVVLTVAELLEARLPPAA
jgi:hypothetical protein